MKMKMEDARQHGEAFNISANRYELMSITISDKRLSVLKVSSQLVSVSHLLLQVYLVQFTSLE